ncbi:hypothetical protein Gotur_017617 [Gossypium turneri]
MVDQSLADQTPPSSGMLSLFVDSQPLSSSSTPQMSLEEKFKIIRSVGEEFIQEDELLNLLKHKPEPICYDGFEPFGRMHIAQVFYFFFFSFLESLIFNGSPKYICYRNVNCGAKRIKLATRELNDTDFDRLLVLLWSLWNSRHASLFRNSNKNDVRIVGSLKRSHEEFIVASNKDRKEAARTYHCWWKRLKAKFIKVDFDTSFSSSNNKGGARIILSDFKGFDWGSHSPLGLVVSLLVASPTIAEAFAAPKAIEFATNMGHSRVVLEGDVLVVMQGLGNKEEKLSKI